VRAKFLGFGKHVFLGHHVTFNDNVFINGTGKLTLGNYFHTGCNLTIITTNHNYENATVIPYNKVRIHKEAIIKAFVWFGNDIAIIPGLTTGEGAIITTRSVVVKDFLELAIVDGNPAQLIRYRDKEEFYKLKEEGKYS